MYWAATRLQYCPWKCHIIPAITIVKYTSKCTIYYETGRYFCCNQFFLELIPNLLSKNLAWVRYHGLFIDIKLKPIGPFQGHKKYREIWNMGKETNKLKLSFNLLVALKKAGMVTAWVDMGKCKL